jgi:hypothetical protein
VLTVAVPALYACLAAAAGGLGPIISLLSRPDSSLVRRCLIALYFIGADKDSLQQAIGAAGALPQLLQLVRSDSPDVQAEATDVLKVLCRNAACGRMLAELNGIEVLVCTAQSGLTSRAKVGNMGAITHTTIPQQHVRCIQLWCHAQLAGKLRLLTLMMQGTVP